MKKLNIKIDAQAQRKHLELMRAIAVKEQQERDEMRKVYQPKPQQSSIQERRKNLKSPARFKSSWRPKSNPVTRAVTAPLPTTKDQQQQLTSTGTLTNNNSSLNSTQVSTTSSGRTPLTSRSSLSTRRMSVSTSPFGLKPSMANSEHAGEVTRVNLIPLHQFSMELRNAQDEKRELSSRYSNTLNELRNPTAKPSAQVKAIKATHQAAQHHLITTKMQKAWIQDPNATARQLQATPVSDTASVYSGYTTNRSATPKTPTITLHSSSQQDDTIQSGYRNHQLSRTK